MQQDCGGEYAGGETDLPVFSPALGRRADPGVESEDVRSVAAQRRPIATGVLRVGTEARSRTAQEAAWPLGHDRGAGHVCAEQAQVLADWPEGPAIRQDP